MNFYEWFFLEKDRQPAGLFSFGHLFSVTLTLTILLVLAVFLAKKFKGDEKKQNLVILITGISVLTLVTAKIAYQMILSTNPWEALIGNFPLYFCDIMIYIIPMAALTKGRFKDCCIDFIAICGLLMGFMGNYFAGNLYPRHAIISWAVFIELLTHSASAFISLFIWCSKLNKMEKRNMPFTIGMLFIFMTIALIIDYAYWGITGHPHNFMFFFGGDGTPFDLFYNLVGGNLVPYQIIVYVLQCGYIAAFYGVYYLILRLINKKKVQQVEETPAEQE